MWDGGSSADIIYYLEAERSISVVIYLPTVIVF